MTDNPSSSPLDIALALIETELRTTRVSMTVQLLRDLTNVIQAQAAEIAILQARLTRAGGK